MADVYPQAGPDLNSEPNKDTSREENLRPNLGPRKQLAPRRFSESRALEWRPPLNTNAPLSDIHITISYDDDGVTPREIFYDGGYKSGSDLEALASEICIVLSIFLQHRDVDIAQFAKSLTQDLDLRLGRQTWASLVGLFIAELQEPPTWERQLQELRAAVEPQLDFDGADKGAGDNSGHDDDGCGVPDKEQAKDQRGTP